MIAKTLTDRMKEYESVTVTRLMKKQPVIIRLDGRGFSKFTRGMDKPFDWDFSAIMEYVCNKLRDEIDGVKLIYSQSDEISLLLTDWDTEKEKEGKYVDTWFDYKIQKIVSIASAAATMYFNKHSREITQRYLDICNRMERILREEDKEEYKECKRKYKLWLSKEDKAMFDCRVFNIPLHEVSNYFIYRQRDAIRNSIQSLSQAYFSQKELNKKNTKEQIEMVKEKVNIDWNNLPERQKQGFCLYKEDDVWKCDNNIPDFVENREFINRFLG